MIFLGSCAHESPDNFYSKARKDAYIIRVFTSQRDTFEKLRTMARADRIRDVFWYIGPDTSTQELHEFGSRISNARLLRYQALLKTLGPDIGMYSEGDVDWFYFTQSGTLAIGTELAKGILYSPGPISDREQIRSDLDDLRGLSADTTYLRGIAPSWYIYFQALD